MGICRISDCSEEWPLQILQERHILTKNSKNRIHFSKKGVSLQRQTIKDEALYPTPPSVAMGQKWIRVRTDILQQPFAGGGFLSAYVHRVYFVLSNFEFYLLFQ